MDPLTAIAERRIQEAIDRGEFDDLPGKGMLQSATPVFILLPSFHYQKDAPNNENRDNDHKKPSGVHSRPPTTTHHGAALTCAQLGKCRTLFIFFLPQRFSSPSAVTRRQASAKKQAYPCFQHVPPARQPFGIGFCPKCVKQFVRFPGQCLSYGLEDRGILLSE